MPDLTPRVKITVYGDCGHVVFEDYDSVEEKYPFYCHECESSCCEGKYPWRLSTEIIYEAGRYQETTSGKVWIPDAHPVS